MLDYSTIELYRTIERQQNVAATENSKKDGEKRGKKTSEKGVETVRVRLWRAKRAKTERVIDVLKYG